MTMRKIGRTPGEDVRVRRAFDRLNSISAALNALEALTGTGLIVRTGTDTYTTRITVAPAAGLTITNATGVAGNITFALANDLSALEGLASTGIAVRSATDTWVQRTITGPAAGISVANGNGVSGNPTLSLANDLSALEGLASTGFATRTTTDTWAQRTLQAPAAGFTITNPAGVAGDPTFVLANDLSAVEGLSTNGIAVRTATSTWTTRTITGTANQITVSNGDGVSGNPTLSTPQDIHTAASPTFAGITITSIVTITGTTIAIVDGVNVTTGTTTGTKFGTAANQLLAFHGATPTDQCAAYTQTYATADRTLSAYTADDESAAYTGIDNAQAGTVYAQLTDLNALRTAYENLRAFAEDIAGMINSVVDDLQEKGLVG